MINFSLTRDNNDRIKTPDFQICNPNYKKIDILPGSKIKNSKVSLLMNGKSTITFEYYKYQYDENGNREIDTKYNLLVKRNTALWKDNSWFIITRADEVDDGNGNKYKEVTFTTCDEEMSRKTLTNIGNYNKIEDENTSETDVNLYALYDPSDVNHSCIHIALSKLPDWELNYLDPAITHNKHTFCIDSIKVYDFLTQEVAKSFDCIILMDTLHKKINCFSYENPLIMKQTGVYLSYSNLIKNYQLTESEDIVTSLRCIGGQDEYISSSANVGISEVNMGSDYLNDYTYVYDQFSDGLKEHYTQYNNQYKINSEIYANYTNDLTALYEEYYKLVDKSPSVIGSTDWTEYGLNQLQTEYDSNNLVVSTYLSLNGTSEVSKEQYDIAVSKKIAIESELAVRNRQIDSKLTEIQVKLQQMKDCYVSINDYLTEEERIELSHYTYEEDYNDSSFATYDTMSGAEALEVKKDFLKNCLSELKKVSKPRFELELELHNMYAMKEFKDMADEISLGCVVKVNPDRYMQEENVAFDIRLTKIEFSFDDVDSISVTFSSKKLLDEFYMEDIFKMAESSHSYVSFNNTNIKNATAQTKITKDFVGSNLIALNNKFMSTNDAEVVQHSGGLDIRKKNKETGLFYPEGMKLTYGGLAVTDDAFQTSKVAIGKITLPDSSMGYGIVGETIMGRIVISNQLEIYNSDATLTMKDGEGFKVFNDTNTFQVNPNDTQIVKILKGNNKIFYIDTEGNLQMTGTLTASTINGGSIYGSYISGSEIYGGSLNINDVTTIDSYGKLTCINGEFKGTIEGSMIKGSTYFTENTSTGSAMRIYDGNIFIEGNNGYIRGIVGTDSFSKLIGISSEDNMVIGHDTAVSSIYGGKRIDINMYTDNFKIRQSSDGGTPTVKIGSYNVIHAGNIDNYLSNYATTSQLSSLESRVSSLESKS